MREFRLASKAKTTNGYAKVPHLFAQLTQPADVDYLIIPRVSSERRRYIPIGYEKGDVISSDAVQIVPHATLYHFGVLTSKVHMAWMRTVCGRLKSDYRYSKEIVYNPFPWPGSADAAKVGAECPTPRANFEDSVAKTAQASLDARQKYAGASFAELYGEKMYLFAQLTQPDDVDYLIIPRVSSERRRYIPIGYEKGDVISSDAVQIVPHATLYHFGVLTSKVHMAWMRTVCGRLKSDYRYSKEIVYNPFPWPGSADAAKVGAECLTPRANFEDCVAKAAQTILDARQKYAGASFAELYGEKMYLFADLVAAHEANDAAVLKAYGWPTDLSEPEIVSRLFDLYEKLTEK